MGAFNPISGIHGTVTVGSSIYCFGKWKVSLKNKLPNVNSFCSAYQALVTGVTSASISLSGPYDAGNMPLTVGNLYTFVLAWNNSLNLSIPAIVSDISPDDDIDGAAQISVSADSTGSFTASVT